MSQNVKDTLDPVRAAAMQVALGEVVTIKNGKPLPPFYHQLYFMVRARQSDGC